MQSEESARRIVDIGAEPDKVVVTGSLKFDSLDMVGPAHDRGRNRVLRYFRISGNRPVIIAASTHKGEDEAVFEVFQRIRARAPETILIIAPRKPERFDDVEQLARRVGWNVARRTELRLDAEPRCDIVVLDVIGELAQLYQIATAVFVGGSLTDQGGHNIIEPAVFGKAIVFGPYMQNFAEIARAFLEHEAAIQVRTAHELEHALLGLLNDPVRRASLGAAARALVEANRGARGSTLAAIGKVFPHQDPGNVRPFRVIR
jgi:3-deoxy-D-manno-octulosonic-acid transferase